MRKFFISIFVILSITVSAKQYKCSEIYSTQSYLYGRFEMRVQSAPGSGQLSTFFLYRNNSETSTTLWQEIDIEIFGKNSNQFQSNVIIEKVEGKKLMTEVKHTTPFSTQEFNTYVLEWTPDSITWYVNDSLYRTEKINAPFCNEAMSIRFNHWAANITNWVGVFDTSILPTYQLVDYISYSKYTPGAGDNGSDFTFDWKDDFDSFSDARWAKANWTFGENLGDFLPANAYTEQGNLVLKLHDSNPPITTELIDNMNSTIKVSPNPFDDSITLFYDTSKNYSITITSLQGTVLFRAKILNDNSVNLLNAKLKSLPKNVYMLVISENEITKSVQKIIKQ